MSVMDSCEAEVLGGREVAEDVLDGVADRGGVELCCDEDGGGGGCEEAKDWGVLAVCCKSAG